MTSHESVAELIAVDTCGESALRSVVPVAVSVIEHSAVGDTYPAVAVAELVGMGYYGECIATGIGDIGSVDAYVGTCD